MKNFKKITSFVTATTITAGILLGSVPTSAAASTTSKTTQAQTAFKNQISAYNKTLNNYKKDIKENDEYIYDIYMDLQRYNKEFTKYGYTGKEVLTKKIVSFRAKLDKTRKDNAAVDMKKVSATFNAYLKKGDTKNAKAYYVKQKAKLLAILVYQDDLMYDIEEYAYEIEEQMFTENEIYIHNQLPTEFEIYDAEIAKIMKSSIELFTIEQEVQSHAYKVLNMDYPIYKQIQTDLEAITEKHINEDAIDELMDFMGSDDLYSAIEKRDVLKVKIAIVKTTNDAKLYNELIEKIKAEIDAYKTNLPVKFADKVKQPTEPTTETPAN